MIPGPARPPAAAQSRPPTSSIPSPRPPSAAPATGAPSPEWVHQASHRQRLELAFTVLRSHGIRALPAYGSERPLGRGHLEAVLGAGTPGPPRPCVLWTRADDAACFGPRGRLQADLPLRSRGLLLDALTLALAAVGLIGRPEPATGGYLVLHEIPF